MRATKAFIAGILLGVLIGTAGLAAAAIGYKGWQGFSTDFKSGYIAGYLMMSKLARNLDPGGWVDEHYPYVLKATTAEWKDTIDAVYAKPENQQYSIESVLQIAAKELAEKHGGAVSGEDRQYALLRQRLQAMREKQIANLKAKGQPIPPQLEKPISDLKLAAPKTVAKKDRPKEKKRKWCRCDGTDPKAARAARRAAREQAAKGAAATPGDAKVPPAPATRTGESNPSPAPAVNTGGAKTPPAATAKPAPAGEPKAH